MRPSKLLPAVLALAVVAIAVVPGAFAETTKCIGTPIAGTTTLDNVKVPRGATCALGNVKVKGSIKVGVDASLTLTSVDVKGNVQGKGYRSVTINGTSRIGGSIQLVDGGESMTAAAVRINGTRIKGEVQLEENFGTIAITSNRINGDVQLFDNVGASSVASEPDRGQPPVQGEPAGSDRRGKHRQGQRRRPVRGPRASDRGGVRLQPDPGVGSARRTPKTGV